jgi:hypothetical protein
VTDRERMSQIVTINAGTRYMYIDNYELSSKDNMVG